MCHSFLNIPTVFKGFIKTSVFLLSGALPPSNGVRFLPFFYVLPENVCECPESACDIYHLLHTPVRYMHVSYHRVCCTPRFSLFDTFWSYRHMQNFLSLMATN